MTAVTTSVVVETPEPGAEEEAPEPGAEEEAPEPGADEEAPEPGAEVETPTTGVTVADGVRVLVTVHPPGQLVMVTVAGLRAVSKSRLIKDTFGAYLSDSDCVRANGQDGSRGAVGCVSSDNLGGVNSGLSRSCRGGRARAGGESAGDGASSGAVRDGKGCLRSHCVGVLANNNGGGSRAVRSVRGDNVRGVDGVLGEGNGGESQLGEDGLGVLHVCD